DRLIGRRYAVRSVPPRLLRLRLPTPRQPGSRLLPYATLFRSRRPGAAVRGRALLRSLQGRRREPEHAAHAPGRGGRRGGARLGRSEEDTSELQSRFDLVCRVRLGKIMWIEDRSGYPATHYGVC